MTPLCRTSALCLTATLLVSGCVLQDGKYTRPRDLTPGWLVDRARILGIRAEPPEARPSRIVSFEALVVDPNADVDHAVLWLACPPEDEGGIGFGCELDVGTIDFETADPEQLQELGFIGFEPFIEPSYVPESDVLDGLDDRERLEGAYVLIQVTAMPPDLLEEDVEEIDFNEIEVGYKRLIVSEATTPNNNPRIASFLVDLLEVPQGAVVHVEPEQSYDLGVELDAGLLLSESPDECYQYTLECYEYLNLDGEVEVRREEPYVSWYTTGGTLEEEYTLFPYLDATWTAPKRSGKTGTWYAVLRDRRGGMAWITQDWVVD